MKKNLLKVENSTFFFKSANPPEQRRLYRLRDEKIRKMSKLLTDGKITVDVFLNGVVFEDNGIFKGRCKLDTAIENAGESDTEEEIENETQLELTQPTTNAVISGSTCVICWAEPSDILLNCGHYKHCLSCFNRSKELFEENKVAFRLRLIDTEPKFKCPHCNTDITAHMHVKKNFS